MGLLIHVSSYPPILLVKSNRFPSNLKTSIASSELLGEATPQVWQPSLLPLPSQASQASQASASASALASQAPAAEGRWIKGTYGMLNISECHPQQINKWH